MAYGGAPQAELDQLVTACYRRLVDHQSDRAVGAEFLYPIEQRGVRRVEGRSHGFLVLVVLPVDARLVAVGGVEAPGPPGIRALPGPGTPAVTAVAPAVPGRLNMGTGIEMREAGRSAPELAPHPLPPLEPDGPHRRGSDKASGDEPCGGKSRSIRARQRASPRCCPGRGLRRRRHLSYRGSGS